MEIKIALPKGRLLNKTASLLQTAGWGMDGYHEQARFYHLKSSAYPNLSAKMFHERDIPIQVAIGNYDLGICGRDWVEELLVKYPSSALVKIRDLDYGTGSLYMMAGLADMSMDVLRRKAGRGTVRIVSEYANLAESFALEERLRRFSVFPVWGGAEAYPPEDADLALICGQNGDGSSGMRMTPVARVLDFSAYLIANRSSWGAKDLDRVVASICENCDHLPADEEIREEIEIKKERTRTTERVEDGLVRIALPDGHQQAPMLQLLEKAGIEIEDYPSPTGNRRPCIRNIEGVAAKVIRPQDMPLQVANGNFDLAITGKDWLADHRYQFPSSPVKELLDLKSGKVRLVAVVSQKLAVKDAADLRKFIEESTTPFRVASEYVNIADRYARDNHFGRYRVIPTWGATEAFLPDDADLLIENTETGGTIARHNLKIIDTLFESTACIIGNTRIKTGSAKGEKVKSIVETIRAAVEDA
ncbi:MAG: ATP phosphoribosyltransferase [Dehalococcoidales bacterium]